MSAEDSKSLSPREAKKQRQKRYDAVTQLLIPLASRLDELKETVKRRELSLYEYGAVGQEYWILKGLQEAVLDNSRYGSAVDATSDSLDILYLKIGLPDRVDEIEQAKRAGIIRALDLIKDPSIDLVLPMYGMAQMTAQQHGLQFVTRHFEALRETVDQLEVPTRLGDSIVLAYSYKHLPTGDGPLPSTRPDGIYIRVAPIKATRRARK